MNAAFLIVTSACLTGADPVPLLAPLGPPGAVYADKAPDKPPPMATPMPGAPVTPGPAPVVTPSPVIAPAPAAGSCGCSSGCGTGCGTGCGQWCESPGLFSRLRGRWSHGCDTCDTCNTCNTCAPAPCSTCDTCARPSFWDRFRSHSSCAPSCGTTCDSCGSPGLFSRLRLGSRSGCGCEPACGCGSAPVGCGGCASAPGVVSPGYVSPVPGMPGTPKTGEPIKVMPKDPEKLPDGKEAALPLVPDLTPASKTIEVGTKSPFELSRRFEKRVHHDADYSQLTGQLFYVHTDGGLWVLRYAPLDTEDRNGGGVILARDRPMDSYREGDLVTVRGEILQERASRYMGAPLYRTSSIQLVERGEP